MKFSWDPLKNAWLMENRGVAFEDVVVHMGRGDVWKVARHPDQVAYPGQWIAFVVIKDYVHMVPFTEDADTIRLITVIPSRKATRTYRRQKEKPDEN